MTRVFDYTIVAVIWVIAVVINRLALELLQPGSPLYEIATDGTENVGGPAFAEIVWQAVAIYIPLIAGAGILSWALLREYRRQAVGTRRPAP